jgi:hypothetical protein
VFEPTPVHAVFGNFRDLLFGALACIKLPHCIVDLEHLVDIIGTRTVGFQLRSSLLNIMLEENVVLQRSMKEKYTVLKGSLRRESSR